MTSAPGRTGEQASRVGRRRTTSKGAALGLAASVIGALLGTAAVQVASASTSKLPAPPMASGLAAPFSCSRHFPTGAKAGQAVHVSTTLGALSATLDGTVAKDAYMPAPALSSPHLEISSSAGALLSTPLAIPNGVGVPFQGGTVGVAPLQGAATTGPLCIGRFGGSTPETAVLVGLYSGGAHCCTWLDVYVVRSGRVLAPPIEQSIGDPGVILKSYGPYSVLVTADDSFAYRFDAFAFSGEPVRVLELRGARLANTTGDHLGLVAAEAPMWWKAYIQDQSPQADPGRGLGLLAAWAADECLLGHGAQAWAQIDKLNGQGRLGPSTASGGAPPAPTAWPTGSQYVKALRAFLAQRGYCPASS